MQIDQGAAATIIVFLALQTGALIFYAGVMFTMIRDHDRRITDNETEMRKAASDLAYLRGAKGLQP